MRLPPWLGTGVLGVLLAFGFAPIAAQQAPSAKPATPLEPIAAILEAFRTHSIVALSEGEHGNEQGYAFRLALAGDPRFAATVNDIVVECGNPRYQGLLDRFVSGGDVTDTELRQIWLQGIEPGVNCDRPIYEGFVRGVRAVNVSLPPSRRLRVLIGEPAVNWATVHRPEDLLPFLEARDARSPVEVIRREVLAKGRRALLVYGSTHFQRKNIGRNYEPENTIVSLLENGTAPTKVFSIWASEADVDIHALQADTASWRVPSLAMLRGTALGDADFTFFYPFVRTRVSVRDGQRTPVPRDQWRTLRMAEQFDAILYLGAPSALTIARLPRSLCADSQYMAMRLGRLALFGMQERIDGLKKYCSGP